jgi:protein phosphatase
MLVVLLGILGGGLYAGWRYTQDQYYVGSTDAGQLAIFRGVPGQIAGFDLSSVHETSPARLANLTTVAQDQVRKGIQTDSQVQAQKVLSELTDNNPANPNLKPICSPTAAPTAAGTGQPSGVPTAGTPTTTTRAPVTGTPSNAPVATPDAPPSEPALPVDDPVGCRPAD